MTDTNQKPQESKVPEIPFQEGFIQTGKQESVEPPKEPVILHG